MTSPWQEWKKKNKERQQTGEVRPWDIFNPDTDYIDEETSNNRLSICEQCEHFTAVKSCTECGCFMPVKTRLTEARCPVGKW